jgi:hypothetical protein
MAPRHHNSFPKRDKDQNTSQNIERIQQLRQDLNVIEEEINT